MIRPCHRVMVSGARIYTGSRSRAGTLGSCSSPHPRSPGAGHQAAPAEPSAAVSTACPRCHQLLHAVMVALQSPMRAWQGAGAQKGGQAGTGCCPTAPATPILLQPGLPMGCSSATNASHHTTGSLLAQEGNVSQDGEPEPCGVRGAGNLLWCVPASAEPKQEASRAGDCCGQ